MNCLCAIYVDRNQRAFLAQMTLFVTRYYVIYHSFPINSQHLMTWEVGSPVSVSGKKCVSDRFIYLHCLKCVLMKAITYERGFYSFGVFL